MAKQPQVKPVSDKSMRIWNEKVVPVVTAFNQLKNVLIGMENDAVRDMAKRDGVVLKADGGRFAFNAATSQWEEQAGA